MLPGNSKRRESKVEAARQVAIAKSCKRKQSHKDEAAALVACLQVYRQQGHNVWPYKCPFCPAFHIGHTPLSVRMFIALVIDVPLKEERPALHLSWPLRLALEKAGIRGT